FIGFTFSLNKLLTCLRTYISIGSTNFFFFNDTATTEIYTLSLHDALPISDVDLVADPQQADGVAQLAVGLHRLPVDGGDDVTGADAGLVGRRSLDHLRHQRSHGAAEPERMGDIRGHRIHAHAQLAALDRAVLDELLHHAARHVRRNGEADADVAPAARQDRGVDSDQLTAQVYQRTTGVAGVDRGVGLDEV